MKVENHPIILNIETSTSICSVSVNQEFNCIFSVSDLQGQNHAALLSVFIDKALRAIKPYAEKPDAVAVSAGPGSYTGLRIGVATAKGLCFGFNIPLIAIDTLQIMTVPALQKVKTLDEKILFCPMIDARRMEVYDALYQHNGTIFRNTKAEIITENSFEDVLKVKKIYFFGNGAEKCKNIFTHPNACFLENINPLAENMCALACDSFFNRKFVDTAYFEPFYLKEFQATKAKNIF
ncbi:tRNA (adenosine(37)-N6)-threonylcarbamoyltransferase complex dimerization subunit type 1 TsaB [Bacteroidia bacterium]|nr:tRNA (adenosine(37)-N6)-threonylcarbamoyltransferase complex dimerization subunit type 1 TsaB [Bacteroidia bacterium]